MFRDYFSLLLNLILIPNLIPSKIPFLVGNSGVNPFLISEGLYDSISTFLKSLNFMKQSYEKILEKKISEKIIINECVEEHNTPPPASIKVGLYPPIFHR